jgi:hypothetical protein
MVKGGYLRGTTSLDTLPETQCGIASLLAEADVNGELCAHYITPIENPDFFLVFLFCSILNLPHIFLI